MFNNVSFHWIVLHKTESWKLSSYLSNQKGRNLQENLTFQAAENTRETTDLPSITHLSVCKGNQIAIISWQIQYVIQIILLLDSQRQANELNCCSFEKINRFDGIRDLI